MPNASLPDPTQGATLLSNVSKWSMLHLCVQGPNTALVAKSRLSLEGGAGLPFVAADGVVSLWWRGELWAMGSGPGTTVNYEVIER